MKSSKAILIWIIGVSLSSIVLLQGYLIYRDYLNKQEEFKLDISKALLRSLEKAKVHRAEKINEQFRSDLLSGEYIIMDSSINESGFKELMIIDKNTGYNQVHVVFSGPEDRAKDDSFFQLLLNKNLTFILKGEVFFWNEALGEKLKRLLEETDIDLTFLSENFQMELLNLKISASHILCIGSFSDKTEKFSSEILEFKKWNQPQFIWAEFDNPSREILFRSYFSVSVGILVLLTTSICFYFLLGLWKKEQRLSELKDVFIDNLSHELLTPITTLNLSINALEDKLALVKFEALEVDIAKDQLHKLNDISKSLHNIMSQEESSLLTGYTLLIDQLNQINENFSRDGSIMLKVNLDKDCHHSLLKIPPYYFQTILNNLIDNSLKYGGKEIINVEISATKEDDFVCIFVFDDGIGIPEVVQEDIFIKFFRHVRIDNHDPGGLGLGLFNVKQTLHYFNSKINLEYSSTGKTLFKILIPIHEN